MDQVPENEAEAADRIKKLTEIDDSKQEEVVNWLIKTVEQYGNLFTLVSPLLSKLLPTNTLSKNTLLQVINFYKKNTQKCKGGCVPQFVTVGLSVVTFCDDDVTAASESLLSVVRSHMYSQEDALSMSVEALRNIILPKMKTLVEEKRFHEALSMWRAVVKLTRFEKIPTSVTNKILYIATMALKQSQPTVLNDVLSSWKILIERLPEATVKKTNYTTLLLNPLNRVYRDAQPETNTLKFSAWWQLVLSLRVHIENHFDQVIVPLIQKAFTITSSKGSKIENYVETRANIPYETYVLTALILYTGNNEILKEMSNLHEKFPVNPHVLGSDHFLKHSKVIQEAVGTVVNNILNKNSPAPKIYSYLFLKILFSRASSLHNSGAIDLSRVFMSWAIKLLKVTELDVEQSLGLFSDIANGAPQKLLCTPNFVPEFKETLIAYLTVFFANKISLVCVQGTENHKKRYRILLRVLLERASSDFLPFTDYFLSHLENVPQSLEITIWTELVERLIDSISLSREVNQGSEFELNFSAIIKTLRYPFKVTSNMTSETINLCSKLITVFGTNAVLLKNVVPNQSIEEVSKMLLEELQLTKNSLHRLMCFSQVLESLANQIVPENVSSDGLTFGNWESLVQCLSTIAKSSIPFISDDKQTKSDCQVFVNVVSVFTHLLHTAENESAIRKLFAVFIPDIIPLFEFTKTKNVLRETCLSQVEAPLVNALSQLSRELMRRTVAMVADVEIINQIRTLLVSTPNHWKRGIRDILAALASLVSFPVSENDSLSQNLSQFVDIADAVAVSSEKKHPVQEKSTPTSTRRSTRSQQNRTLDNDDFTPIRDVKKKSILTEHQLEKRAESKIIPSMYQDLSQSNEAKNPEVPPVEEEELVGIETVEVAAEDSAASGDMKNVAQDQSKKENDFEIDGIRPMEFSDANDVVDPPIVENVNNENDEPTAKKKKRFSYKENDEILENVEINQQPSSLMKMAEKIQQQQQQQQQQQNERGENENELSVRSSGIRKRKIGQYFESPLLNRPAPKSNFLANSPSSRSRKMLEAAQAKQGNSTDARHMLAGSTPRHNNVLQIHDSPPRQIQDERRMTIAAPVVTSPPPIPSARRSILKRFSTGASAKRVSFSKSNEVCSFLKHPRISTAKSLCFPVTVEYEEDVGYIGDPDASPKVDLCEKSFHEDLDNNFELECNEEMETTRARASTTQNSILLELNQEEEDVEEVDGDLTVKKNLFEDIEDFNGELEKEEFVDAESPAEDFPTDEVQVVEIVPESSNNSELNSNPPDEQLNPAVNLIDSIKSADATQRKQILAYVSSPEFLATMSTDERNSFAIRVFASIGFYVQ